MDTAKIKFLEEVRSDIANERSLTGDQMGMFSHHYGSGTGTILGVASGKTSIDMVLDLKRRVILDAGFSIAQIPEFRKCPETDADQIQYHNTAMITSDGKSFIDNSCDVGLVTLMLCLMLDVLIARERSSDD